MPLAFEQFIFDTPPPALEIFRKRLEERYGLLVIARENNEPAAYDVRRVSEGELSLAEAPDARVRWSVHLRTPIGPSDEMFRELGWLPPACAAPHYEAILVGDEPTVLRALADELRRGGGRPSDDDGAAQIAEPLDLARVPEDLAKSRRHRPFWMTISIIGVVLYLILIIALLPIWILTMSCGAIIRHRRLFICRFRFRKHPLTMQQFDRNRRFARYLLDRIGHSGGTIGARRWFARSRINCRLPAREWAGRQRAWAMGRIPWPGTAELVRSLCHTTFGAPWYIQFADQSPELLSDWLNREMRRADAER